MINVLSKLLQFHINLSYKDLVKVKCSDGMYLVESEFGHEKFTDSNLAVTHFLDTVKRYDQAAVNNINSLLGVDGDIFNSGRAEGQSDIAVLVRKIIDESDVNHLNLNGTIGKVKYLLNFYEKTSELINYIYQSDALKEFAYERGDFEQSIAEMLKESYSMIKFRK